MRRLIKLTALVAVMVFWAAASYAADDFLSMFKDGKPMGQIRTFYIDRNYNKTYSANDRSGFARG
ncbi:MAG: hypothetical protein ACUVQ2_03835 [Dissulfurimicrobium sp.]|uniref:hypothetical protein n=1 Tax=Dissulfurimicrobium sp. TaxID=2022436 RepID=UPI00404B6E64